VFAREPAGRVKTRLAAGVGEDAARGLYRAFLDDVCGAVSGACQDGELCVTGVGDELAQLAARHGLALTLQGDGDLGARMERALCARLPAVLIGSDVPTVTSADLAAAIEALGAHDLVLGPSEDGGYWLVGMRRPLPIFEGIAWSTPTVLADTLARAPAHLVARHDDVDDLAALTRLEAALAKLPATVAPATRYQLSTTRGRPDTP
jgi:rSAM/selenodomain-associated transferase 1